jgi:serine/threonine protein kinase
MSCSLSDEELWSGIDRNAPEVTEHMTRCPSCRSRAKQFQIGIKAVAAASTPAAPPLPSKIGPYAIRRRLGEGGMGIVYEGEQETPKRLVAVKVIRGGPAADEYRVRMFQREAQTLARLRHPAIAAVYEAGRTGDGQHFFAMELIRGEPLNEYVRDRAIPRGGRLALFRKICDAVNYAHQRGVIHRDLKPTNILVDPDGNPKILDFGLARITDPDAARTTATDVNRIMGTLPYMSPEDARGDLEEMDVRSDIYSLGVLFYELLTDQLPYTVKRAALPQAVRTICEEHPRKPATIDRTLRGDLETICLKALEKEPGRRYQSAALFAEDIERYQTDQPILARRASGLYQLRKFVVRHRLFVIFALSSIVLVTLARLWVDRIDEGRRADIVRTRELLELREAVVEYEFAELLCLESGRYDKAEQKYRNALAVFQRLGQDERSGPALVGLGTLLLKRTNPTEKDYGDAEQFLDAALGIFESKPGAWITQRRFALEGLRTLYGADVWDEPDLLDDVQQELAALDAGAPRGDRDPLPPP